MRWLAKLIVNHPLGFAVTLLTATIFALVARTRTLQSEVARADRLVLIADQNASAAQAQVVLLEGRYRRQLMQLQQQADDLQRELEERPVLTSTVTVQAPPERREEPVATETTADSSVVYTYDFDIAVVEVEVDWLSQLPPVIMLEPKPLALTYRVACGPGGPVVDIEASGHEEIDVAGTVDPEVCNPPVVAPPGGSGVSFLRGLAVGALATLAIGVLR